MKKQKCSGYVPVSYTKDPSAIPFAIGSKVKSATGGFDGIATVVDAGLREPVYPAGPCIPVAWLSVDGKPLGVVYASTLEAAE